MEELALHLMGAVGCTVVLTMSSICAPIRRLGCKLLLRILPTCPLYCGMCTGTWVGLLFGLHHFATKGATLHETLALSACFAFSVAVLAHCTTWWLRSKGHYCDPVHDGWQYGPKGYEEID